MVWGERLYPTDFFIFQLDSCILSLQSETPAGLRYVEQLKKNKDGKDHQNYARLRVLRA